MVRAEATAKYIRTSAQKSGLVLDLIRGKDVNMALSALFSALEVVPLTLLTLDAWDFVRTTRGLARIAPVRERHA